MPRRRIRPHELRIALDALGQSFELTRDVFVHLPGMRPEAALAVGEALGALQQAEAALERERGNRP